MFKNYLKLLFINIKIKAVNYKKGYNDIYKKFNK